MGGPRFERAYTNVATFVGNGGSITMILKMAVVAGLAENASESSTVIEQVPRLTEKTVGLTLKTPNAVYSTQEGSEEVPVSYDLTVMASESPSDTVKDIVYV